MTKFWSSFWSDESGQGFTEYALMLALVAVGLTAALVLLRDEIGAVFETIGTELEGAPDDGWSAGDGSGTTS